MQKRLRNRIETTDPKLLLLKLLPWLILIILFLTTTSIAEVSAGPARTGID
ncbi:MAG: hypothetical protein ACFFE8_02570 [Candidatus Heimdallarchaeota archaeon]